MGKKPTIQMIAELAGVSRGTVDRVLNNRSYVKAEVRERVLRIANEQGYVTPREAHLREQQGARKPLTLGVLLPSWGFGHQFLEEVQTNLSEMAEDVQGGYVCNYPVFRGIYRTLSRMVERTGLSVYLVMCTIVDSKGNPMRKGPILDRLTPRLKEAIIHSTRHSDIINQYADGQYLILLTNTSLENCEVVQRRIRERFLTSRQRTGVAFHINSVGGPIKE